jgi:hypothetical protein
MTMTKTIKNIHCSCFRIPTFFDGTAAIAADIAADTAATRVM